METEILARLIEMKYKCLEQLRNLGRRQVELVDGGDMTELVKVLSAKHQPIGMLQAIEKDLEPFRGQDPDRRRWHQASDRERCARQAAECQELLDEIVAMEKQCEVRLVDRRDATRRRLEGAHHAGQARAAYMTENVSDVGMLDLTSDY